MTFTRARFFGFSIWCLLFAFESSPTKAEGLIEGAAAFIRRVITQASGQEEANPAEIAALRREIEQFPITARKLAPAEAAHAWLKLVDRAQSLSPRSIRAGGYFMEGFGAGDSLLKALPPPAAWPELAKAGAQCPAAKDEKATTEVGLRLLTATLTGDRAARSQAIGQLQAIEAQRKKSEDSYFSISTRLDRALVQNTEDPEALVRLIEPQLKLASTSVLELPDLLTLLGPERAERFLRRVLVESPRLLTFSQAEETQSLARRLALELVDKLRAPQWKLACALDGAPLYEALQKRFGDAPADDENEHYSSNDAASARREARMFYFLSLIASNRIDDAMKMAAQRVALSDDAIEAMDRAGYAPALTAFLHKLLAVHPEAPFWENYVQLAAKSDATDEMLALARSVAARADFTGSKANNFRLNFYKALLAADQVEEAVGEMRKLLAMPDREDWEAKVRRRRSV